jgi:F-type H+-transporting ATPase subunit c
VPPAELFSIVVTIAAGLSIGVGVIFPAVGQARAVSHAIDAMARQPDESGTITRNLFVGLAMIESQALYVLIVALVLLFANPLAGQVPAAVAKGGLALWLLIGSAVGAAFAVAVGTMFSSLGQGSITGNALDSIAEQPAMRDQISTTLFVSLAFLESLSLYALIVALILLFANPLLSTVLHS